MFLELQKEQRQLGTNETQNISLALLPTSCTVSLLGGDTRSPPVTKGTSAWSDPELPRMVNGLCLHPPKQSLKTKTQQSSGINGQDTLPIIVVLCDNLAHSSRKKKLSSHCPHIRSHLSYSKQDSPKSRGRTYSTNSKPSSMLTNKCLTCGGILVAVPAYAVQVKTGFSLQWLMPAN